MATGQVDSARLKGVGSGGLIREDVMNKIFDISKIPLPFTDMIGSESSDNEYKEWTIDKLAPPNTANAVVDGSDAGAQDDTQLGKRVGNHHQISTKVVAVSFRANASNVIGRTKETAYQISRRQQELRRDVEAIALSNLPSVADTGAGGVAGKVGGLPSWLATNHFGAGIGSQNGGFESSSPNGTAGTKLTYARTVGTQGVLTETNVRNAAQAAYNQGGEVSILMSTPAVIRKFSEYLFTANQASGARVAQNVNYIDNNKKQQVATGSINVFVSDFGTLRFVPNRLQPTHVDSAAAIAVTSMVVGNWYTITTLAGSSNAQWLAAGDKPFTGTAAAGDTFQCTAVGVGTGQVKNACADVFFLDPEYVSLCFLQGYRSELLAKTGLSEKWQMSVDYSLIVNNEAAHAIIGDVNMNGTVTF